MQFTNYKKLKNERKTEKVIFAYHNAFIEFDRDKNEDGHIFIGLLEYYKSQEKLITNSIKKEER